VSVKVSKELVAADLYPDPERPLTFRKFKPKSCRSV
jgi:hypothetical protein